MTTKIIIIALTISILITAIVLFTSCESKKAKSPTNNTSDNNGKYKVICTEGLFTNVKKSYKAGDKVKIYFPYVATDTDYTFYLDGERFNDYEYDDRKGFVFTFTIPAKDVELTFESRNSMENPFHTFNDPVSLVTYTKRISTAEGDDVYEVSLESTEEDHEHLMTVYNADGSKNVYIIPVYAYESLYNYTNSADLKSWNDLEDYECLDGMVITFNILIAGEYITVSTNKMPPDSESTFNYLHSLLGDYMTEKYQVE